MNRGWLLRRRKGGQVPLGASSAGSGELPVRRAGRPGLWKVLVLAASPATATVRFVHARHQGRPYEDVQVQTSSLMLIEPLDTLDQQGP